MPKINYSQIKEIIKEKGIYFSPREKIERLKDQDYLSYKNGFEIEEGCAILRGSNLPYKMGLGSYSWSTLPITIKIGRYCSISSGLNILGTRHPIEAVTSSSIMYDTKFSIVNHLIKNHSYKHPEHKNPQKTSEVTILHDVWIGARVTLSRGITIHTGAVVASDSVVTRDVPPYAIVGGNPAKLIKSRFREKTIQALLESEWWEYSPGYLSSYNISNPEEFLATFKKDDSKKLQFKKTTEVDFL